MKIPKVFYKFIAFFMDICFHWLGDQNPDFYTVSFHMTTKHLQKFNIQNKDSDLVYYQSYGAIMRNAFSDLFFFLSYLIVYMVEGENDGIVSLESAKWTNFKGVLAGATNRGISHADLIDIRRWNLSRKRTRNGVIDIRDVYLTIVSELKNMGF